MSSLILSQSKDLRLGVWENVGALTTARASIAQSVTVFRLLDVEESRDLETDVVDALRVIENGTIR